MICWRSLDATDVCEIGRYFSASDLLPFLKIAVTLAFFRLLEFGCCRLIIEKYCGGLEPVGRHTYLETVVECHLALVI